MLKVTPDMSATEIELRDTLFAARLDAFHASNEGERASALWSAKDANETLERYMNTKR